jgi:hypothetical protein
VITTIVLLITLEISSPLAVGAETREGRNVRQTWLLLWRLHPNINRRRTRWQEAGVDVGHVIGNACCWNCNDNLNRYSVEIICKALQKWGKNNVNYLVVGTLLA